MSVINGQPANATTFNNSFVSRSGSTDASGVVSFLNKTEATSDSDGAVRVSGGMGIAKNLFVGGSINAANMMGIIKVYENQQISDGDILLIDNNQSIQFRSVSGHIPEVGANILPFGSNLSGLSDGTIVILMGSNDVNAIKISFNDSRYGAYINGDAILKRGYILTLIWNATLERFFEIARSF